jgi:hypothetical protein
MILGLVSPQDKTLVVVCGVSLAEKVGFEPTIGLTLYTRSRRASSTTRAPLRLC